MLRELPSRLHAHAVFMGKKGPRKRLRGPAAIDIELTLSDRSRMTKVLAVAIRIGRSAVTHAKQAGSPRLWEKSCCAGARGRAIVAYGKAWVRTDLADAPVGETDDSSLSEGIHGNH